MTELIINCLEVTKLSLKLSIICTFSPSIELHKNYYHRISFFSPVVSCAYKSIQNLTQSSSRQIAYTFSSSFVLCYCCIFLFVLWCLYFVWFNPKRAPIDSPNTPSNESHIQNWWLCTNSINTNSLVFFCIHNFKWFYIEIGQF